MDLELTNYWLLLIWIFGGGMVFSMMPKKNELVNGRICTRWYWFSCIMLALPYIVWAGYRGAVIDTLSYARGFINAPSYFSDLPAYINGITKDRTYYAMVAVIKCLGVRSYQHYFLIIAAFQMLCMINTFRKYSPNFWVSMFLFIASTDYVSWMLNGIRQFFAVCLIFAAFDLLVKRRYILFSCVVVLASRFHGSALLMLPFAYIMSGPTLNRKTLLMIVAVALIVPFIDRFTPLLGNLLADTQYDDIMINGIWDADDGTNIFRVLVYSVPALLALFGRRYIIRSTDSVMNLCVNASIITTAIYLISSVTSGIYIGRIPIYTTLYGYMALPWLIDQIFEKQTTRLIYILMIGFYLVFFYYQMHSSWGLI